MTKIPRTAHGGEVTLAVMRINRLPRPQRRSLKLTPLTRPTVVPRSVINSRSPEIDQGRQVTVPEPNQFQTDPYEDYGRYLTPEGGILLVYKDIDDSFEQNIWRFFIWFVFTALATLFLLRFAPATPVGIKVACWIIVTYLNQFIVAMPVEIYRRVEIRPDCMIVDGNEVFWQRFVEGGGPSFGPGLGGITLRGIYGTRLVEFFTVRRFDDEFSRATEILAMHFQEAVTQLWNRPV